MHEADSHIISIFAQRRYGQQCSNYGGGFGRSKAAMSSLPLDIRLQKPAGRVTRAVAPMKGSILVKHRAPEPTGQLFRKSASKIINLLIRRTTGKAMGDYGMLRAYRACIRAMTRGTGALSIAVTFFSLVRTRTPVHHAERGGDSKYVYASFR